MKKIVPIKTEKKKLLLQTPSFHFEAILFAIASVNLWNYFMLKLPVNVQLNKRLLLLLNHQIVNINNLVRKVLQHEGVDLTLTSSFVQQYNALNKQESFNTTTKLFRQYKRFF